MLTISNHVGYIQLNGFSNVCNRLVFCRAPGMTTLQIGTPCAKRRASIIYLIRLDLYSKCISFHLVHLCIKLPYRKIASLSSDNTSL